jgi:hypothetical protein
MKYGIPQEETDIAAQGEPERAANPEEMPVPTL